MYIKNNYNTKVNNFSFGNNKKPEKKTEKDALLSKAFEKKCSLYPKDRAYFNQLAKEINLPKDEEYKLNSIIGEEQLRTIVQNSSRDDFNPGEIIKHSKQYTKADLEALAKKGFRLNLHMHTTHSDGSMSVKTLLDKAAEYADIVSSRTCSDLSVPSFIIAVTDHDNLDGAKEAVRIITSNPEKYKNLGVVLGSELSAIYRNEEMLAKPFAYELVAYAINPFDKQFNDFLARTRTSRIDFSKQIINQANEKHPDMNFSYEEACKFSQNPKKGIDGFLYSLASYFNKKAEQSGKQADTHELCLKYLPDNKSGNNSIVNTAEDLFANVENGFGFLGIAHPAKIYLGDGRIKDSFITKCKAENKDTGRVIMETFVKSLKDIGGAKFAAVETNYQSYEGPLKEGNDILHGRAEKSSSKEGTVRWLKQFREYAQKFNLLETGGLDTHSENPFLRK